MSSSKELIDLLTTCPSDENIQLAIRWITGRKQSDKSARSIIEILMDIPQAGPHLADLIPWLRSAKWNCLEAKTYRLISISHLDFLLSLLKGSPDNELAGRIWGHLLSSYTNREIIEGASDWLLNYGEKDICAAGSIAATLLEETSSPEIIAWSQRLLEQQRSEFMLARSLLYKAPDERTIDIAIEILHSQDPRVASIVAPALMQSGKRGAEAVSEFLNKHRESKHFHRLLESCAFEAPDLVAPFVCEWVSKHPRSRATERMLVDVLCQNPTPEYAKLLWIWCQTNSRKSDILNVMTIFMTGLPVPKEAVLHARDWLESNESHTLWTHVLLRTIEQSTLDEQISMTKRWLPQLSELLLHAVLSIILRTALERGIDEELAWSEISKAIDDPTLVSAEMRQSTSEEINKAPSMSEPVGEYPLVQAVFTKDPKSIQAAKDWLIERRLEWRWGPINDYKGEIIAALLAVSPDQLVNDEARRWLERRPAPHNKALYEKVSSRFHNRPDLRDSAGT